MFSLQLEPSNAFFPGSEECVVSKDLYLDTAKENYSQFLFSRNVEHFYCGTFCKRLLGNHGS